MLYVSYYRMLLSLSCCHHPVIRSTVACHLVAIRVPCHDSPTLCNLPQRRNVAPKARPFFFLQLFRPPLLCKVPHIAWCIHGGQNHKQLDNGSQSRDREVGCCVRRSGRIDAVAAGVGCCFFRLRMMMLLLVSGRFWGPLGDDDGLWGSKCGGEK